MQVDLHNISEEFYKSFIDRATVNISCATSQQFNFTSARDIYDQEPWLDTKSYLMKNYEKIDQRF